MLAGGLQFAIELVAHFPSTEVHFNRRFPAMTLVAESLGSIWVVELVLTELFNDESRSVAALQPHIRQRMSR